MRPSALTRLVWSSSDEGVVGGQEAKECNEGSNQGQHRTWFCVPG